MIRPNMVKKFSEIFIFVAVVLLYGSLSAAQTLPSLPADPAVATGSLPDRIKYYLVSNPTCRGMAELSLVWRLGVPVRDSSLADAGRLRSMTAQQALATARKALAGTDLFSSCPPVSFFRRNGVQGGAGGYIDSKDNALIFRFTEINLNKGEQFLDSLLLMAFDLVREYSSAAVRYGAADCGQAIIFSGDIDQGAVLSKMKLLSLFVRDIAPQEPERSYAWMPGDSLVCRKSFFPDAVSSHIVAEYSSRRVPDAYIGTVLPVVSEQMCAELGLMLGKRIERRLAAEGIPFSGTHHRFRGSLVQGGDEKFSVSVNTVPGRTLETVSIMSSALSDMSRYGVSLDEYAWARKVVGMKVERKASGFRKSNAEYVRKCIASFLYGSAVVSASDGYKFFSSSGLPDSSGLGFFNRFASSLTGNTANLVLSCTSDSASPGPSAMRDCFLREWGVERGRPDAVCYDVGDTSVFDPPAIRCRISRTRNEKVSGGVSWTFSNGIKVIYKHLPAGGRFWYSMILKGGFSSVDGLEPGQGAFFSDMLDLYRVAGMDRDELDALLSFMDIDMRTEVGPSYMKIAGSSASGSLTFLIKVLSAMASDRETDSTAFSYYAQCERLRLEERAGFEKRMVAVDSIVCPDFRYSVLKSAESLAPELQSVADRYFRQQFSKCNDGVLVIVGDLDEDALKKTLQTYAGSFPVSKRMYSGRGYGQQPVSGASTYIVDGPKYSLDLVMSASVELDAQNYMASKIVAMALKDAVVYALQDMPSSVRTAGSFAVFPSERLNMAVNIEACDTSGFAEGVRPFKPVSALFAVRSALEDIAGGGILQEKLDVYKTALKNDVTFSQDDPEYWMDILSWRIVYGKDFQTDYQEKIDAVTPDMVRELIHSLDNGTKVEYIVRPKRK